VRSTPTKTERTRPASEVAAAPAPGRALEIALLLLALAGLAFALELTVLHARAHAGAGPSFCSLSERVNCDKVALSPWSVLFGVPLGAWGALAYLAVAGLAATALGRARPHPGWPGGLLGLATGAMSATAVALAIVSELVIRSLCLMCAASWLVSFTLLGLSWRLARRAGGVRAALAADLAALRGHPLPAAGAAALVAVAAAGLVAAYARAAPPPAPAAQPAAALGPVGPTGSIVVFEYSDYECPHCARRHEEDKPVLARRPDVRLVRRHFPLDQACNPLLKRPFHEGSCQLARAGICAEAQGRFEEMDDLLFRNQAEKAPVDALARRLGLDPERFRSCLTAPETEDRLARDIAEGIRAGVRGTPSYEWNGKVFQGDLGELLAAVAAGSSGR